jgi:hypothetical protein
MHRIKSYQTKCVLYVMNDYWPEWLKVRVKRNLRRSYRDIPDGKYVYVPQTYAYTTFLRFSRPKQHIMWQVRNVNCYGPDYIGKDVFFNSMR